jgi:hypothetical protein
MDSLPDLQPVSNSDNSKMEENLPDNLDDMDSLPDLESVSDSKIDKKDLLENFGEKYIIPSTYPFPLNNPKPCSKVFNNLDSPSEEFEYFPMKEKAYVTTYEASVLRETPGPLPIDVNLYDLGASRHMSGFCHRFVNFVKIPPKPITAADRRSFSAVGKGDIWVYLPNGEKKASQVLLKDVLYVPAMGVTLVSISCIASAGYMVVFTGTTCQILNNERKVISTIQMKSGLYRVFSTCPLEGEYAGKARVEV